MSGKQITKIFSQIMTNANLTLSQCDNLIDAFTEQEVKNILKEMCRNWVHVK
jgi:hypothetical protein